MLVEENWLGLHSRRKQRAPRLSRKLEVVKLVESMRGVLDVGGKGLDKGGQDRLEL